MSHWVSVALLVRFGVCVCGIVGLGRVAVGSCDCWFVLSVRLSKSFKFNSIPLWDRSLIFYLIFFNEERNYVSGVNNAVSPVIITQVRGDVSKR